MIDEEELSAQWLHDAVAVAGMAMGEQPHIILCGVPRSDGSLSGRTSRSYPRSHHIAYGPYANASEAQAVADRLEARLEGRMLCLVIPLWSQP